MEGAPKTSRGGGGGGDGKGRVSGSRAVPREEKSLEDPHSFGSNDWILFDEAAPRTVQSSASPAYAGHAPFTPLHPLRATGCRYLALSLLSPPSIVYRAARPYPHLYRSAAPPADVLPSLLSFARG